ncbi:hypothetical protein [Streptomyces tsukubensis]|nr:hypothetical protein [Streptomyces tsukubensis]
MLAEFATRCGSAPPPVGPIDARGTMLHWLDGPVRALVITL